LTRRSRVCYDFLVNPQGWEEVGELAATIGIRREDRSHWERRTPITPAQVKELREKHDIEVWIQPSTIRVFTDDEYRQVGAKVTEDLSPCPVVFAVKEIPSSFFTQDGTYVFFSHVIKGQSHNMPMLRRMLDLDCQLIDYEKMLDDKGRRVVFFGRFAGLAGMIDSLWALGRRLDWEGVPSPFRTIDQAVRYGVLEDAMEAVRHAGEAIKSDGVPRDVAPLVVGFAGYGSVSRGAQEILDLLPVEEVPPSALPAIDKGAKTDRVYKVVFKEEDMVRPVGPKGAFDLQDYYKHPEKYETTFFNHLPYLSVLVNCIYWDARYPRLVSKSQLWDLFAAGEPKIKVVGDISCDVDGSIEFTVKATTPGSPVFVYDPATDKATDGVEGNGTVVLAVDNLPCELPRESSTAFGEYLMPFIPQIASADYSVGLEELAVPRTIKDAIIVYHGELTPQYGYLEEYL
jgi:saccharopine dehydrogenase (NAD+, L-lysine-forming)